MRACSAFVKKGVFNKVEKITNGFSFFSPNFPRLGTAPRATFLFPEKKPVKFLSREKFTRVNVALYAGKSIFSHMKFFRSFYIKKCYSSIIFIFIFIFLNI